MSYEPRLAAALSGVTRGQLNYWRRPDANGEPLLVPERDGRAPIRYSFRDVIALRTIAYLRDDVSLQKIRRAVANLRGLGERGHLAGYRLVALGDSIVLVDDDGEGLDLVAHPGQRLIVRMVDVLAPFENRQGLVVPDFLQPRPHIEVNDEILGGMPVIAGTRVPFEEVAGLLRDGVPAARVKEYFPHVSAQAAREAVDYADYVDRAAA